jgi:membrane associated rhomboid family serine protease
MFLPLRTDAPLRTTPYMNWALIVVNVLVWVAQAVFSRHLGETELPWYYKYMLNAGAPDVLTFITYGFLHANAMHIIGNMLFLYIFGNNVNDKMGHIGYLAFYLSSIAFSGIFYCLWQSDGNCLGASGGVSAIVGAYLVLFPRSSVTVLFWFFLSAFEIPSIWFVAAFFLKDIIGLSGTSEVAHSAHIGGTLFGFFVCTILLAFSLLPRDQFDIVALIKQWNRRRQYRDAVNAGWNPYAGIAPQARGPFRPPPVAGGWVATPPVPEAPLDPRQQQILDLRARITQAITNHNLAQAANLYLELKAIDPQSVLARQSQLDIANQLASEQRYVQAAEAYETFLRTYPKYEQTEQLELMLGIILSRFLKQPARAREYLLRASAKLMDENARQMARAELEQVNAVLGPSAGNPPPFPGATNVGGAV